MKNYSLPLLTSLLLTLLLNQKVLSQNVRQTDPGISVYNYKHVNKAKKARKEGLDGLQIKENSLRSVSKNSTFRKNVNQDYTPKYRARENAFVIYTKQKKEKLEINPLTSSRNYKTPNSRFRKSEVKDSLFAAK